MATFQLGMCNLFLIYIYPVRSERSRLMFVTKPPAFKPKFDRWQWNEDSEVCLSLCF